MNSWKAAAHYVALTAAKSSAHFKERRPDFLDRPDGPDPRYGCTQDNVPKVVSPLAAELGLVQWVPTDAVTSNQ